MIRLETGRDGRWRPVERGQARTVIVTELARVLDDLTGEPDRRGPAGGHGVAAVDRRRIVAAVDDRRRAEGLSISDAAAKVAVDLGWSPRTVERVYYEARGQRRDQRSARSGRSGPVCSLSAVLAD
jgi:hypothetical protein